MYVMDEQEWNYYDSRFAVAMLETTDINYGDVKDIAVWVGESGSTYTWPQGMKDNRRSRVLARIARYGIEPPVSMHFFTVLHRR